MAERVAVQAGGALARLTLVAPDRHNAIDMLWVEEFEAATDAIAADPEARALLITAAGSNFTVGGDLAHIAGHADRLADELEEMIGPFHRGLTTLSSLEIPVVSAVQGAAAGGGLGLLWSSDFVLLADDARLAAGFSKLGLSGDGGSSWFVPTVAGALRAREFLLGGRILSAAEAVEWGLATRVVPTTELAAQAESLATEMAAGPTLGFAGMKRLIAEAYRRDYSEGLQEELHEMRESGSTSDAREGVEAFAERRPPQFRGHQSDPP